MKSIIFLALLGLSFSVEGGEVAYPYGCDPISPSEGMQWVYPYRFYCSLRQAPELIQQCKEKGRNGESPFYDNIETSLAKSCYNKNGRLRVSWCLWDNTWEQGEPSSRYWGFQSAKVFRCYYN